MVKKILLLACTTILVISCDSKKTENKNSSDSLVADTITIEPIENITEVVAIDGNYSGVIPCADCEGIKTNINLSKDGTYKLTRHYLGKKDSKPMETKGTYILDKNTNKVTLNEDNVSYKAKEGKLAQLDQEGNEITGNLASKYVLVRETEHEQVFKNEDGDKLKIKETGNKLEVKEKTEDLKIKDKITADGEKGKIKEK